MRQCPNEPAATTANEKRFSIQDQLQSKHAVNFFSRPRLTSPVHRHITSY